MPQKVTKAQALKAFREMWKEQKHFSQNDVVAKRTAWNEYTDALCKGGQITVRQYETWTGP